MRIGIVGMGKLGYPCATALATYGHRVIGVDVNASVLTYERRPYKETWLDGKADFNDTFQSLRPGIEENLTFGRMADMAGCDVVFVAVQTPHDPRFEGVTRLTAERKDFDYRYLRDAIIELSRVITRPTPVAIISTVLPGTIEREIRPLLTENMKLCYNPFFIAMGTTMRDFVYPEFVLLGVDDEDAAAIVEGLYRPIIGRQAIRRMTIEEAELTKVAYNTFIGMKIVFANTLMEICDKTPNCDADNVSMAIKTSTRRLISPAYLSGGMGDGGGCHPRDNIAMSWLAGELGLSHDFFEDIMLAREHQTEYLANVILDEILDDAGDQIRPLIILGYAFKPGTNLIIGSPAILLANMLRDWRVDFDMWDPEVDGEGRIPDESGHPVYFIGCRHPILRGYQFPEGSTVIDPFRYLTPRPGVEIIGIGASSRCNKPGGFNERIQDDYRVGSVGA